MDYISGCNLGYCPMVIHPAAPSTSLRGFLLVGGLCRMVSTLPVRRSASLRATERRTLNLLPRRAFGTLQPTLSARGRGWPASHWLCDDDRPSAARQAPVQKPAPALSRSTCPREDTRGLTDSGREPAPSALTGYVARNWRESSRDAKQPCAPLCTGTPPSFCLCHWAHC